MCEAITSATACKFGFKHVNWWHPNVKLRDEDVKCKYIVSEVAQSAFSASTTEQRTEVG